MSIRSLLFVSTTWSFVSSSSTSGGVIASSLEPLEGDAVAHAKLADKHVDGTVVQRVVEDEARFAEGIESFVPLILDIYRNVQIELYFPIVQRKALTPNDFNSLDTLAERLLRFGEHYRQIAEPFNWTFTRGDHRCDQGWRIAKPVRCGWLCRQRIANPPSTSRTAPVIDAARSDTRNATASATSVVAMSLPSGTALAAASR